MELTNELLDILLEVEKDEYTNQPIEVSTNFYYEVLEQFKKYSFEEELTIAYGIML